MNPRSTSPKWRLIVLGLVLVGALALRLSDQSPQAADSPIVRPTESSRVGEATRISPDLQRSTNEAIASSDVAAARTLRLRSLMNEGGVDVFAAPAPPAAPPISPLAATPKPAKSRASAPTPAPPVALAQPTLAPPPPADPPAAPAFPYRVLGRYENEGAAVVFLDGPQGTLAVAEGRLLDGAWKIDSISVDRMTIRYQPSNTIATVSLLGIR